MRLCGFVLIALASWGMVGYAAVAYTLAPVGSTVHPAMQAVYEEQRVMIILHIAGSEWALLLGPLQFMTRLRAAAPRLHRWFGRTYLGAGVLVGGAAGLYMSFFAFGGAASTVGFAMLALVWLFTGAAAYTTARRRSFASHRDWMVRNFGLTLSAVTLRAQLGVCAAIGWPFEAYYPMLAWTCWIPNLIVAEWIIRRPRIVRAST